MKFLAQLSLEKPFHKTLFRVLNSGVVGLINVISCLSISFLVRASFAQRVSSEENIGGGQIIEKWVSKDQIFRSA